MVGKLEHRFLREVLFLFFLGEADEEFIFNIFNSDVKLFNFAEGFSQYTFFNILYFLIKPKKENNNISETQPDVFL